MDRRFKRSFDELPTIFDFTAGFFARCEVPEIHRFTLDFVVEEIFTNLVKYHPGNPNEIRIELAREGDTVRVVLTDYDVDAFDVRTTAEKPVNTPLAEREPGGLGLQLTRKMVDTMDYAYDDERRISRITLTKRLS